MSAELITVSHSNVSPVEAQFIKQHFVDASNAPDRPKLTFQRVEGDYDEEARTMTISAELSSNTTPEIGRVAIEQAFYATEFIALAS